MFMFGRCHRSLAAVTPAKYECDLRIWPIALQGGNVSDIEINERRFKDQYLRALSVLHAKMTL